MKIRKITDPYYGRGIGIDVGTYAVETTVGVCDRLIGFSLIMSPPFDTHKINAGDEGMRGFLEIGVKISLAWLTFNLSFHRWNEYRPFFNFEDFDGE